MNKFWILFLPILLLNCSFDTKSGFWTQEQKIANVDKNIQELFKEEKKFNKEFNPNLKLKIDTSNIQNKEFVELYNNSGLSNFNTNIKKTSKFKFSKIENFNYFEPDLISDGKNLVFFDDKANLIKFDETTKIIWKKNFYSKSEKKLKPILTFALEGNNIVVIDSMGKIYNIDFKTGDLIWSKTNTNPFNSQLKIYKNKIYAIDMNNVLRCYSLKDGSELWKFNSEDTFLKSKKRNSIAIKNGSVFFNNSLGDIIAINAESGTLLWQTPTQSSTIYENAFGLRLSDLVISGEDLLFSNNRNEFYSLSLVNGVLNWKQKINSSVRPVVINNLVFTFSEEGYFFLLDKKTGNIIRVTNIFKSTKKKIYPVGFIVGKKEILLSTNIGHLLIIDTVSGKTKSILKIDNGLISRPFIFNNEILLAKDNSIIRLN